MPTRQGRRNRFNLLAVEPLRGTLTDDEIDRLVAALGLAWAPEAVTSLIDACGLDIEQAKATMLQTCGWILAGAIAHATGAKQRRR